MKRVSSNNVYKLDNMSTVREFIIENFLFGEGEQLKEDTSFFEKGIIDSTGVMELVSFIEETYLIKVEDDELVPENFSSLEKVIKYLQQKPKVEIN